jgi:Ni,Fe-hydrogenase III large subunit
VAVLAIDSDHTLLVARSEPASGAFESLAPRHPQVHLFERELAEQHGLFPTGHPRLRAVRIDHGDGPAVQRYFEVEGREVHEVAVGPVHAGVIEPGHFRFQCHGENVLHLEIALGYQHRGIEKAMRGGPHRATLAQMETIAGDTSIGHATAYATALEALAGTEVSARAHWLRALALELERLANHTGDLGALANDVAFLPVSAACGRIRGDFLNLTAMLCGNRFGRRLVRPGGCGLDLESDRAAHLRESLGLVLDEAAEASDWLWESNSTRTRFEGVGVVSTEQAIELGLVGPAARASGVVRDVRSDHPIGWYRHDRLPPAVWTTGDVFARARVRALERRHSGAFLLEMLESVPEGPITTTLSSLQPGALAVALVEGWRGEICHVAVTDAAGRLTRYKIIDPSFHNWPALERCMRGQAVSDFPVCNKSFNLSYCGFDL